MFTLKLLADLIIILNVCKFLSLVDVHLSQYVSLDSECCRDENVATEQHIKYGGPKITGVVMLRMLYFRYQVAPLERCCRTS